LMIMKGWLAMHLLQESIR